MKIKKYRRLREDEIDYIVLSYTNGDKTSQIAEKVGCDPTTVINHLNKRGIDVWFKSRELPEYSEYIGEHKRRKLPPKEEILKRFIYDKDSGKLISKASLKPTNPTKRGYVECQFGRKNGRSYVYREHRLIFFLETGEQPEYIDHIDRNKSNNHISNLRVSNGSLNQGNKAKTIKEGTTSKYKGVSFSSERGKWVAAITMNSKLVRLGEFHLEDEAAKVYNNAAIKHFGDHACLNIIEED